MATMRSVPLTYAGLADAIATGVFPHERTWIDFKRRLFPEGADAAAGRARASEELAKDMASMAVHGGFLVYGVKEDKVKHLFTVDEMSLEVGLHETVEAIAHNRITPSLAVVPTPVPNPADPPRGFLVIEVPASPDSPHMAGGSYWGRSETGNMRLSDQEVERLILGRNRYSVRLAEAMHETAESDPISLPWKGCHFYFTAVPATGWADMFADYTRDHASRMKLSQFCASIASVSAKGEPSQRPRPLAFENMNSVWRSQKVQAGWLGSWTSSPQDGTGRTVGVDDDGTVRYMNLGPYGPASPSAHGAITQVRGPRFVRENNVLFETWDMIRLVAALSEAVGYRGSWLIGVELDHLGGHMSQVNDLTSGFIAGPSIVGEKARYTEATRASALQIRERAVTVTARLLRQLLRGLGTEVLLSQPPFDVS
jgi:hypothetical protein